MNSTPISLLERLRNPTEQASWERFVLLYTPLMFLWTRRLGLADSDADDLVQEVFTLLVQKLPQFQYDPQKRFRGWLWTLLVNKWREKNRNRKPETLSPGADVFAELSIPDPIDEVMEAEYRHYIVQRALQLMQAEFEPTTWIAFHECVHGDRAAAEVAAKLGVSIDAVYAAKSRVLRRLREELAGLMD